MLLFTRRLCRQRPTVGALGQLDTSVGRRAASSQVPRRSGGTEAKVRHSSSTNAGAKASTTKRAVMKALKSLGPSTVVATATVMPRRSATSTPRQRRQSTPSSAASASVTTTEKRGPNSESRSDVAVAASHQPLLATPSDEADDHGAADVVRLDATQQAILDLATSAARPNLFITGRAGAGKSAVLKSIIRAMRPSEVLVTAPTGVAAVNVGGTTLHHAFGVKPGGEFNEPTGSMRIAKKLDRCRTVIIDEISMVSPALLASIDAHCKMYRRSSEPFGGLQVITCGDFMQLRPVGGALPGQKYGFQTTNWFCAAFKPQVLSVSHRQGSDPRFVQFLNAVRDGEYMQDVFDELAVRQPPSTAVLLRSTNREVDVINAKQFDALTHPVICDSPIAYTGPQSHMGPNIFAHLPQRLCLKPGCRVMLTKNINIQQGLVNGLCGTVVDVVDRVSQVPVVAFDNGMCCGVPKNTFDVEELGTVVCAAVQFPLRLAWAVTIHKSQGATLEAVDVDLRSSFEPGQAYVAMSRARRLAGLSVRGATRYNIKPCPVAAAFAASLLPPSSVS